MGTIILPRHDIPPKVSYSPNASNVLGKHKTPVQRVITTVTRLIETVKRAWIAALPF